MGYQDIRLVENKNCKHTKSGECLNSSYCNAYGCPDKKGFDCEHKNRVIKVISTVFTCETTVTICTDCNKHLTEPETDCR